MHHEQYTDSIDWQRLSTSELFTIIQLVKAWEINIILSPTRLPFIIQVSKSLYVHEVVKIKEEILQPINQDCLTTFFTFYLLAGLSLQDRLVYSKFFKSHWRIKNMSRRTTPWTGYLSAFEFYEEESQVLFNIHTMRHFPIGFIVWILSTKPTILMVMVIICFDRFQMHYFTHSLVLGNWVTLICSSTV